MDIIAVLIIVGACAAMLVALVYSVWKCEGDEEDE